MNLYTDGTIQATTEEINTALTDSQAADAAAREATATELQEVIDADAKLKSAGITAVADTVDEQWVAVTLPTDEEGVLKFWAGQIETMVLSGGQDLGSNKARMRKDKMQNELVRISALL